MKKFIIIFILSLIIFVTTASVLISVNYSSACDIYAENGVKGAVASRINGILYRKLDKDLNDNIEFISIGYDKSKKINEIRINSVYINNLANAIATEIHKTINENNFDFGIPYGNLLGLKYLSGKGVKMPVKIIPISATQFEIESELISGGLNQTLHRVSVNFYTEISCLTPFHSSEITVYSTVIISETLIVGDVPQILLPTA